MERARQWGMRCLHEAKLWPHSVYVTLTYNDECMPPFGSLSVRDVQLFMKRLRKAKEPGRVRFFLGGEYGDENKRPHYHALLFNCQLNRLRSIGSNKRGEPLYTSDELAELWSVDGKPMGYHTLGAVTFDSAVYCAKYALKKVNGPRKDAGHYDVYDEYGEVHERTPEFAVMSRRPGIGAGYIEKYGKEVLDLDSIVVNGKEVRPPRFYDERLKARMGDAHDDDALLCLCESCKVKRARKRAALLLRDDNTPERLSVKEKLMEIGEQQRKRAL